jgi:hypothetical protein
MMAVREPDQADFDLERLFEMMDEALTSRDPRVQNSLRGLLTIVELTRTQDDGRMAIETSHGPLRQIQEDLKHLTRRLNNLEGEVRQRGTYVPPSQPNPYTNPGSPYSGPVLPPGAWWGPDPNAPRSLCKTDSDK